MEPQSAVPSTDNYAAHACQACRRLKRGCSKDLPGCSLCLRLNKRCVYGPIPARTYADEVQPLLERIRVLENRLETEGHATNSILEQDNDLPEPWFGNLLPQERSRASITMFCLDATSFARFSPHVLNARTAVPPEIRAFLGTSEDLDLIPTQYFSSIDNWCRALSRKRILQKLAVFNPSTDASFALLLLCMKLVVQEPSSGESVTRLYQSACHFASFLEHAPTLSLELLQARILITVYELGHGIYPAAYLSTGHLVRMGQMMGFHDRKHAAQLFRTPQIWTVREEERRAWWGIFILDRSATEPNQLRGP